MRELGRGAHEVIRTGAPQVPQLVRAATDTVGAAVQGGTQAAASARQRGQEQITRAVHDSVVAPVPPGRGGGLWPMGDVGGFRKRAWHFLVFGFLLCFLVPLFALRSYAPLNTVVSNLGVLYLAVISCCPPSGMRSRSAKAALILLRLGLETDPIEKA